MRACAPHYSNWCFVEIFQAIHSCRSDLRQARGRHFQVYDFILIFSIILLQLPVIFQVRELCILRLIHAFCEAAPMLLLQVYFLAIGLGTNDGTQPEDFDGDGMMRPIRPGDEKLADLTTVSAGLSLWSVCWAVASFSKGAARLRNLERLVLTWLGVLAQLVWRLGTVSARVGALVAYASIYGGEWLVIVVALHWLSMLTWLLLTPDGLFRGDENLPILRKIFIATLLAFVYVFSYVNLHETNHRQKMVCLP